MKIWLRRLAYVLIFVIWLLVMSFPVGAAVLAARGQIEVGSEQSANYVRVFLVQERQQEGVGVEWTRQAGPDGCREGQILYAMWKGTGQNARYCTCYDAEGAVVRSSPGTCSAEQ